MLAARYGLFALPGIAELVAAVRRHDHRSGGLLDVSGFARRLGEHVWVIPSPESAERTAFTWGSAVDEVAAVAAADERLWLVDAGRLSPRSWAMPFAVRARLAVIVAGTAIEDLLPLPSRVATLRTAGAAEVGVLLVGRPHHALDELRGFVGTDTVWQLRSDRDAAALADQTLRPGRARRSALWREAVTVAAVMADLLPAPSTAPSSGDVEVMADEG